MCPGVMKQDYPASEVAAFLHDHPSRQDGHWQKGFVELETLGKSDTVGSRNYLNRNCCIWKMRWLIRTLDLDRSVRPRSLIGVLEKRRPSD
jgi:hypothetical protein